MSGLLVYLLIGVAFAGFVSQIADDKGESDKFQLPHFAMCIALWPMLIAYAVGARIAQ